MRHQKLGARAEYRQAEEQRTRDSAVDLAFYNPEGVTRNSQIKYTVNLANAKSVFRFSCQNSECIGGDFDLSEELAKAVAARRKTASGEMCCQGWRNKTTIDTVRCHNILRYKLSFGY